jgi:hypothetical protein
MELKTSQGYRDDKGRWIIGNPGGSGRPTRIREEANQRVFDEVINNDLYRLIVNQIARDALGVKAEKDADGKQVLVKDDKSTASSRRGAQQIIVEQKQGKAITQFFIDRNQESEVMELLKQEALDELRSEAEKHLLEAWEVKEDYEKKLFGKNMSPKKVKMPKESP